MKYLLLLLLVFFITPTFATGLPELPCLIGCEGPPGPPGADGANGKDGLNGLAGQNLDYNVSKTNGFHALGLTRHHYDRQPGLQMSLSGGFVEGVGGSAYSVGMGKKWGSSLFSGSVGRTDNGDYGGSVSASFHF